CICGRECEHDVAVVDLTPVIEVLERGFKNPNHLAVDIIHGSGEKQERADIPAEMPHSWLNSRDSLWFNNRSNWIANFHESTCVPDLHKGTSPSARRPVPTGNKDGIPAPLPRDESRTATERHRGLSPDV